MESNYNAANYCHRSIYHLVQANSGLHIKPILFEVFINKSIFDGDRYRSSSSACEWVACIAAIAVSAWGHHCAPVLHGWPSPTVSWQDTTTRVRQSVNQSKPPYVANTQANQRRNDMQEEKALYCAAKSDKVLA